MNNLIFACEPISFAAIQSQLLSTWRARIAQGPIDDAIRNGARIERSGDTALIRISGILLPRAYSFWEMLGLATNTVALIASIRAARQDEDIQRIVLLVDSPGGSVQFIDEAAKEIREAAREKPVIAQVDGGMMSAAYYLGSQATEIISTRTSLSGGIGTKMVIWDLSEAFGEAGIKTIAIDTGEFKSAGEPGLEITERQQDYFQGIVDGYMAFFRDAVMAGRKFDGQEFERVSDGRAWLAENALALGLIDKIQGTEETLLANVERASNRLSRASAQLRLNTQRLTRQKSLVK